MSVTRGNPQLPVPAAADSAVPDCLAEAVLLPSLAMQCVAIESSAPENDSPVLAFWALELILIAMFYPLHHSGAIVFHRRRHFGNMEKP